MPAVRDAARGCVHRVRECAGPWPPRGKRREGTAWSRTPSRRTPIGTERPVQWRSGSSADARLRRHERRLTLLRLGRPYAARDGAPIVHEVDPDIFRRRYFGLCLRCTFCHDACCEHGVDVGDDERRRILAYAELLEPIVGVPHNEWFTQVRTEDADFAGGGASRTAVVNGRCIFLQRGARGCTLHAFALARGEDYHAIKPMVSALFPVTFGGGTLMCSDELSDGSLVCGGDGPTAYEMARDELAYYFGAELVRELDLHALDIR